MKVKQEGAKFTFNNRINVLKQIREALGYTQREFVVHTGISLRSIVRYELGQREPVFSLPQIKKLQRLLFKLGLDFQDLPDDWNIQVKLDKASECQKEKVGAK